MVRVDVEVASAEELVERVARLLETVEPTLRHAVAVQGRAPADRHASASVQPVLDRHAHALQRRFRDLAEPGLGSRPGVKGKAARLAKRATRKVVYWYVEPRWRSMVDFNAAVSHLANDLGPLHAQTKAQLDATASSVHGLDSQIADLDDKVQLSDAEQRETAAALANVEAELSALTAAIREVRRATGATLLSTPDKIDYAAFEARFRGSSEHLMAQQGEYVPLFGPTESPGRIVDFGCGRGEMVKLLADAGHDAVGVDADATMLAEAEAAGIGVVRDDGFNYLAGIKDSSLKGIFCAQVVEHLYSDELLRFIELAATKIRPGGLLLIETIDPRSTFALKNSFYMDLGHFRPVHPDTLGFLCEQAGFADVKIMGRSRHAASQLADQVTEGAEKQALQVLLEQAFGFQDYTLAAQR